MKTINIRNKILTIPICEVFTSMQGEGFGLGLPCIFIRTFGCNLRCQFKGKECDTPYSVINGDINSNIKSSNYIVNRIKKSKMNHIVWTGGEPAIHQDFIIQVMKKLRKQDLNTYSCEIETNGTIPIKKELIKYINWFNVSVKLKSSNQENKQYDNKRINHKALKSFPKNNSFFKFVYVKKTDIREILKLSDIYKFLIYLMPEGTDRNTIIKHSIDTVKMCIKYKFRFSPREHIIIWNKRKGV